MTFSINDGTRVSRLALSRRATGELEGEVPQAHRDMLAAAKARVAPFDHEILRAASHRIVAEPAAPPPVPEPARRWGALLMPLLAAAAALLLMVQLGIHDDLLAGGDSRSRRSARLEAVVVHDGLEQPWIPGTVLTQGDVVQLAYSANGQGDTVVLLSIDGEGTMTVLWPARGDVPEPVQPDTRERLREGTTLSGAHGPEAFVVFFGTQTVAEATRVAEDVFETGGVSGLLRLASQDPAVDVVVIDSE